MAGEFEDCTSLQADTLPTGSISFGRFELESLSWERRSSFSHNRYLEEVEKYSTPGSVTQKKAYFEAHFRKKALERQASSEVHNELDWQSAENGIGDHISYIEEYSGQGNGENMRFARNDEMPDISNVTEHDMEITGRHIHFSWHHGTPPAVSDEDEYEVIEGNEGHLQCVQNSESRAATKAHQHDIIDCELVPDNASLRIPAEPMRSVNTKAFDYPNELVEQDEVPQSESRYDTIDTDDLMVVVEQKKENGPVSADEIHGKFNVSCNNSKVEKDTATCLEKTQNGSFNVSSAVEHHHRTVEQKPLKAKQRKPVPVTTNSPVEKSSLYFVKAFNRTSRKTERENTTRIKKEKQVSVKFSPSTFSDLKNMKTKNSRSLKSPAIQVTGSLKDMEEKKDNARPPSVSTNRSSKDVCSTKTETKQNNSAFSFKCDERAEKRKEFNMKLEEKHHAKEIEMNDIEAKTQIEIEAEMKLLRRRLNFKATPMPSFYHGEVPSGSNGRKVVVTQTKSLKLQSKSTISGGRVTPKANSAISKAAVSKCSTENEQITSTYAECHTASEGGDTSYSITAQVPSKTDDIRDNRRVPQSAKVGAGKNDERRKPTNQQQGEFKSKKEARDGLGRRGGVGNAMKGIVGRRVTVHVAS